MSLDLIQAQGHHEPQPGAPRKPRSGGPRTPEGKARSRMNAVKHGKYARYPILRTENDIAYHLLSEHYLAYYSPISEVERRLVLHLASIDWRLSRHVNVETEIVDAQLDAVQWNEFAAPPDGLLSVTASAINRALLNPAYAFCVRRESALIRDRQLTIQSLLSLRRNHQPVHPAPSSLHLDQELENEERTTELIDSNDPAIETNKEPTDIEQHNEPPIEPSIELPSEDL